MLSERFQSFVNDDRVENIHGPDFFAIGAGEELGEVLGLIKRVKRGDKEYRGQSTNKKLVKDMKLEIGDVLWYLTGLAQSYGLTLEEIFQANYDKIQRRDKAGTRLGKGSNR